jgi:hypothetical protein
MQLLGERELVAECANGPALLRLNLIGMLWQSAQKTWKLRRFSQSCGSGSGGVLLPLGERGEQ